MNIPQAFVGWMAKFAVFGPSPEFDLGDERGLSPDDVLPAAVVAYGRFLLLRASSVVLR